MSPNTVDELQALLTQVALMSEADINKLKGTELKSYLQALGVKNIERGDVLIKLKSARVGEMKAALLKLSNAKKEQRAKVHTVNSEDNFENLGKLFAEKIIETALNQFDPVSGQIVNLPDPSFVALPGRLAMKIASLTVTVDGEIKSAADKTKLHYRGIVLKEMKEVIDSLPNKAVHKKQVNILFSHFRSALFSIPLDPESSSEDNLTTGKKASMKDKAKLATRTQAEQIVNLTPLLQWAYDTLQALQDGTNKKHWRSVSCALALACGRRMVEIHQLAEFTKIDDYTLSFTGQAKAKGVAAEYYAANPSYEIPTLLPADLVIKGIEWLESKGKRLSKDVDPRKVNKNYSGDLSDFVNKNLEDILGVPLTYHKLRALYGLASIRAFYDGPQKAEAEYLKKILGHDAIIQSEYATIAGGTTRSYLSDFELSDDSICKM